MLSDFLVPFFAVGLAEMVDKSQLVLITLSSRYKQHGKVFLGVLTAFVFAQAFAVIVGKLVAELIPQLAQNILITAIFLGFGIYILLKQENSDAKIKDHKPFLTAFTLIFISEMGDKTQIATMLFATSYNPWLVFFSTVLVLSLVSLVSIYIGKRIKRYVHARILNIITGIIFILLAGLQWL